MSWRLPWTYILLKHFFYSYMASDIWLRTILIVREETRCRYMGYSFRLAARVLLYAPSHSQDRTYHSLCYTNRGSLAGTRNSSMGHHEGLIQRPSHYELTITLDLHLAQTETNTKVTYLNWEKQWHLGYSQSSPVVQVVHQCVIQSILILFIKPIRLSAAETNPLKMCY